MKQLSRPNFRGEGSEELINEIEPLTSFAVKF